MVPGFANRLLAPTIRAAAVHFEQTCHYFRNCHVTGVPVRREFFNVPPRPKDARPTLLVFGGSQGAHAINRAVLDALPHVAGSFARDPHHSPDRRTGLRSGAGRLSGARWFPPRFRPSSTTCRERLPAPICCSAVRAPARLPKSPRRESRQSSFLCQRRPTIISGITPPHWPRPVQRRLLPQAELSPERLVSEVVSLLGDSAALDQNVAGGARLCSSRRGCYHCLSCRARGWCLELAHATA